MKEDLESRNEIPKSDQENNTTETSKALEDRWMVRECWVYKDEYKECRSFRARFQQYFVHGEPQDCHQWKKDYDNCCKYHDNGEIRAAEALVSSERARRMTRLRAHYGNPTWKSREAPPADWLRPLPEWIVKRDEDSFLAHKAKELRGEAVPVEEKSSFCSVM